MKRDRPDLAEQVEKGQITLNDAAIEAKVKTLYGISIEESRKQLGKHGRPTKEEQENKGDNNHVLMRGTTGAEYLTARIARDRPDILARLDNREFRSVREAGIEAGIIW